MLRCSRVKLVHRVLAMLLFSQNFFLSRCTVEIRTTRDTKVVDVEIVFATRKTKKKKKKRVQMWKRATDFSGKDYRTKQTTFISGTSSTLGPFPPGRTLGSGLPQSKPAVLRCISISRLARCSRICSVAGQMRVSALVE